jgi:hypothetical protein
MKIYGDGIYDNERADLVFIAYIEFSLKKIQEHIEWLENTNEICQAVLGYIDMLLFVSEKSPSDLTGRLKESEVAQWKNVFDDWFNRVEKKIPNEYKNSIRVNADILFDKLKENANSLEWL